MPFKSEKQRKWMHANEPEMAKRWEKKKKKEALSGAELKKAHKKFKDTGELPPHLKKLAKELDKVEKKFKVKDIVVPGLEWMSKIKEVSVNEAPDHDLFKKLKKVDDQIIKLLMHYTAKADVGAVARSWMMGLHAKLKKAGIKV